MPRLGTIATLNMAALSALFALGSTTTDAAIRTDYLEAATLLAIAAFIAAIGTILTTER